MASGLDYYAILGIEPTLDADAIEQAYRSRSLPFRVGQLRRRADETAGPTQEELEEAYHILSNPQSRLLYYRSRFPDRPLPKPARRRLPVWLWVFIAVWLVAIAGVIAVGLRSRSTTDGGVIGQIVQTSTIAAAAIGGRTPEAGGGVSPTSGSAAAPTTVAPVLSVTVSVVAAGSVAASNSPTASSSPTGSVTSPAVRPTVTTGAAVATAATGTAQGAVTTAPPSATNLPATMTASPPSIATQLPPTAAPPPTATPAPPVAVAPTEPPPAEPPPAEPPPAPEPTPRPGPPPFAATDRIGTPLSVNLRNGPGANYPSLGLLPTGTLLRATGRSANAGGQLWRQFDLQDGRRGWVRDLDVFAVR